MSGAMSMGFLLAVFAMLCPFLGAERTDEKACNKGKIDMASATAVQNKEATLHVANASQEGMEGEGDGSEWPWSSRVHCHCAQKFDLFFQRAVIREDGKCKERCGNKHCKKYALSKREAEAFEVGEDRFGAVCAKEMNGKESFQSEECLCFDPLQTIARMAARRGLQWQDRTTQKLGKFNEGFKSMSACHEQCKCRDSQQMGVCFDKKKLFR